MKYVVVVLGCRTNQYEGQAYVNQLEQMGYRRAKEEEVADVCIVNTCTVTESADRHSRTAIRQLVRQHPGAKMIVTGCFAEKDPKAVLSMVGVTDVVSNRDKEQLLQRFFPEEELPEFNIKSFEAHTRAFVKIQDGCNSFCSYCIIPYVRGRSRSRPVDGIVREVEGLVSQGYQEIVLTGINIGDYDGADGSKSLADLVRAVDNVAGIKRVRLSSIDPDEVDDSLMDAILNGKHTCPSMHIVLQSGSNVVLKRMRRKYTRQIFQQTVEKLLSAHDDFTFTTDVIVGFPGETETDFKETLEIVRQVQFAKVHVFPYSDRPGTKAAERMPDKVSAECIKERKSLLLRIAEQSAYVRRAQFVGRSMTLLTESNREGEACGHTDNFLMVRIPETAVAPNNLIDVELTQNTGRGLLARPLASS